MSRSLSHVGRKHTQLPSVQGCGQNIPCSWPGLLVLLPPLWVKAAWVDMASSLLQLGQALMVLGVGMPAALVRDVREGACVGGCGVPWWERAMLEGLLWARGGS